MLEKEEPQNGRTDERKERRIKERRKGRKIGMPKNIKGEMIARL